MKLHRVFCGGACWAILTGSALPARTLEIDPRAFSLDEPAAAPVLPYRLDGLDTPAGSPRELVAAAETLLLSGRFSEARPVLDALADIPELALESNFMEGYVALEQQDYATAEERLRAAVAINPEFTRARAELGRALMGLGRRQEADEQFQIAERDRSLPEEVQNLIRLSRRITAERVRWSLTLDAAATADSNVSNGTSLSTIDVRTGGEMRTVPVHPAQRRADGVGASMSARAGVRVRAGDRVAVAVDSEAYVNEFDGPRGDEASALVAAGPELSFDSGVTSIQALAYQRWYEGVATHQGIGVRARYQDRLAEGQRLYLYVDGRVFESDYGDDYGGWQATGLVAYERALDPRVSMSGTLFARREWLGSPVASNSELGVYLGLNALLPLRLRGGLSGGVTRVWFDEALPYFSADPRSDWRWNGGLFLTTRRPVFYGLWPTLSYTYVHTASSIPLYSTERHRLRLNLRRDF